MASRSVTAMIGTPDPNFAYPTGASPAPGTAPPPPPPPPSGSGAGLASQVGKFALNPANAAATAATAPAPPPPPPLPPPDAIDPATGRPYGLSKGDPTINSLTGQSQDPSTERPTGPTSAGQAPQPYLEDLYKQFGSAYMAPTYTGQAMGGLQSQLKGPGAAEQFYQQAQNTATDPYYQRLQQQGTDALNQQMAARGHFNSGGAIAGLGNFQSGLAAQQYHQMGDLANQAQSQGQARVGLSGQLAQTADQTDLNRLNGLFGVAGQAEGLNQQGTNNMLNHQLGVDSLGAGLGAQFYGQGGNLSNQDYLGGLQAQAGSAQASAQGGQAGLQTLMGIAGLGVRGATGGGG